MIDPDSVRCRSRTTPGAYGLNGCAVLSPALATVAGLVLTAALRRARSPLRDIDDA